MVVKNSTVNSTDVKNWTPEYEIGGVINPFPRPSWQKTIDKIVVLVFVPYYSISLIFGANMPKVL